MTDVKIYESFASADKVVSAINNSPPDHVNVTIRQINWSTGNLWVIKSKTDNLFYGLVDQYSGSCSFIEDNFIKELLV